MSALDLIAKFGKNLTVTRQTGAGDYVDGDFVKGTVTTFTVKMSVQPLNGREILQRPEGQRNKNIMKGYSPVELFTIDRSELKRADIVTWNGNDYEVQEAQPWESLNSTIAPYWKVILAQVNP